MKDEFEQSRESERVTCKKCGAVSLVEFVFEHRHGSWEDEDSYECANCGERLGSEKAFSVTVTLIEKPIAKPQRK